MKNFFLNILNKCWILCTRKVMLWSAATVVFVVFMPFFINLLTLLGWILVFFVAARWGLLSDTGTDQNNDYDYYSDEDHNDEDKAYKNEVDLGFH